MRWLRRLLGGRRVQLDPGRQQALLQDVQYRYGPHARSGSPSRSRRSPGARRRRRLGGGDPDLSQVADEAHADLQAQAHEIHRRTGRRLLVHRRNYRPLWKEAGPALRWPLFTLPCGFHPYAQVAAAVTVVGNRAPRLDRVTDPNPLVTRVFEVLDLTTAGWEYGRVRVDTDAATLADRLIVSAGQVLAAMDDPPRLPPPVRELMRRNNTLDVHDPAGPRATGGSTWARGCGRSSWSERRRALLIGAPTGEMQDDVGGHHDLSGSTRLIWLKPAPASRSAARDTPRRRQMPDVLAAHIVSRRSMTVCRTSLNHSDRSSSVPGHCMAARGVPSGDGISSLSRRAPERHGRRPPPPGRPALPAHRTRRTRPRAPARRPARPPAFRFCPVQCGRRVDQSVVPRARPQVLERGPHGPDAGRHVPAQLGEHGLVRLGRGDGDARPAKSRVALPVPAPISRAVRIGRPA